MALERLEGAWASLFNWKPLSYLAPFADLTTFLLIALQCLWTWLFVYLDIGEGPEYDTQPVLTILTATLGFILPLQMNAALSKNKSCLDNYNAFVGDLEAFAWDIIAFHKPEKDQETKYIIRRVFDILVAMPAMAKWHFRGGASLDKVTTLNAGEDTLYRQKSIADMKGNFVLSLGGQDVVPLAQTMPNMAKVEVCFFKLLDYVKTSAYPTPSKTTAHR